MDSITHEQQQQHLELAKRTSPISCSSLSLANSDDSDNHHHHCHDKVCQYRRASYDDEAAQLTEKVSKSGKAVTDALIIREKLFAQ